MDDPLERLFVMAPDQYAFCIIRYLDDLKTVRFTKLQELLGVNSRTLSNRLKQLERRGLITRTAHRTIPPRVDYALSAKGRSLATKICALADWADRNCPRQPLTARQRQPRFVQ